MTANSSTLTRSEIRKVFKRNIGAQSEVARRLDLSHVTVSRWLKGQIKSKRLEGAMAEKAQQLLDLEVAEGRA